MTIVIALQKQWRKHMQVNTNTTTTTNKEYGEIRKAIQVYLQLQQLACGPWLRTSP